MPTSRAPSLPSIGSRPGSPSRQTIEPADVFERSRPGCPELAKQQSVSYIKEYRGRAHARPPSGNSASTFATALSDVTALELDLKGLSFTEKWEAVGATNPHAYVRSEAAPSPMSGWNHEAQQFSGMIGSVKMKNGDLSRRSAVRAASSLPPLPRDVARQQKYLRETGSPFRLLVKASGLSGYAEAEMPSCGKIPRPDHLGLVEKGLLELNTGQRLPTSPSLARSGGRGLPISARSASTPALARNRSRKSTLRNVADAGIDPVAAMAAIGQFKHWCIELFRDAEYAWNTLNPAGNPSMDEGAFVSALKHHGYPQDQGGCVNLFKFCKQDEAVTEKSFYDALESVSCGRTQHPVTSGDLSVHSGHIASEIEQDQDDVEAQACGYGSESLSAKHEKIVARLKRSDAVVGELIEYLFKNVGTLKLAFKQLDMNGNGDLSRQEFVDGLGRLKPRGGSDPVETHMKALYKRLDYEGKGSARLEDLVSNLQTDKDPGIARLWKFIDEAREKSAGKKGFVDDGSKHAQNLAATNRDVQFARLFKVGHATSVVTAEQFCLALTALKYPGHHASELFRRLDKDDSGVLSLAEFTAFLQKDVPVRREVKGPVKPLGNEKRIKQVTELYSASENSYKLRMTSLNKDHVTLLDKLQSRCDSKSIAILQSGTKFSSDGGFMRPDYVGIVEGGLADSRNLSGFGIAKPTELSLNGSHLLRVHADQLRDLAPQPSCMRKFNEHADRCRISAF